MRIKHYFGIPRKIEILDNVSKKQEELIIEFFKKDNTSHFFSVSKIERFKDHELLTVNNFKDFVFSEEQNLSEDTYKIYATNTLINSYPESFGIYGENIALYEDKEIEDINNIYYPNIEYIRILKKDYLKELKVLVIKDNKIIEHHNIGQKYLIYIDAMLRSEILEYTCSEFVYFNKDVFTFYDLEIDKLILDLAANLDNVYSYYRDNPWESKKEMSDIVRYFPKIIDNSLDEDEKNRLREDNEKILEESKKIIKEYIQIGEYVKKAIEKDNFNIDKLDNFIKRRKMN